MLTLATIGGDSYDFQLRAEDSVLDAKRRAAVDLGRPSELQRWLVNGAILEDDVVLAQHLIK